MLVTLQALKAHLRIMEDECDEDEMLTLYGQAATLAAIRYLDRDVYQDEATLKAAQNQQRAGRDPIVADAAIRMAVLLMAAYWYRNREDVSTPVALPMVPSSRFLLLPYRVGMGV